MSTHSAFQIARVVILIVAVTVLIYRRLFGRL
jgi:hypothetical protein